MSIISENKKAILDLIEVARQRATTGPTVDEPEDWGDHPDEIIAVAEDGMWEIDGQFLSPNNPLYADRNWYSLRFFLPGDERIVLIFSPDGTVGVIPSADHGTNIRYDREQGAYHRVLWGHNKVAKQRISNPEDYLSAHGLELFNLAVEAGGSIG